MPDAFLRLLLLFVCLLAQPLHAAEYRVASDENLAPYSFRDASGQPAGIDIDVLNEVGRRLDIRFRIELLPWKRVLQQVEQGQVALASPLFRTPEREQFAQYTGPVHYSALGLFAPANSTLRFTGLADLDGKRLGINRGFVLQDEFDRAVREGRLQIEEVNAVEQNIRKLQAGRIDLFAANVISTQYALRNSGATASLRLLPRLLQEHRPAFLVISRRAAVPEREQLARQLEATLNAIHQDGSYARIVSKYTGQKAQ